MIDSMREEFEKWNIFERLDNSKSNVMFLEKLIKIKITRKYQNIWIKQQLYRSNKEDQITEYLDFIQTLGIFQFSL